MTQRIRGRGVRIGKIIGSTTDLGKNGRAGNRSMRYESVKKKEQKKH